LICRSKLALLRAGGLKRCDPKGSFSELRAGGLKCSSKDTFSELFDDNLSRQPSLQQNFGQSFWAVFKTRRAIQRKHREPDSVGVT